MYVDGVRSPRLVRIDLTNRIEPSSRPGVYWGANGKNTEFGLREIVQIHDGVFRRANIENAFSDFSFEVRSSAGHIIASDGTVRGETDGALVGHLDVSGMNSPRALAVDSTSNRVFLLAARAPFGLTAHDLGTLQRLATIRVPGGVRAGDTARMIRWGPDGLAYVDRQRLYLLRWTHVGPG